jgi:2-keto-4-pentenoate hydratase/2-oxohepta-3-ene-1,7-dioic acid hydratase in catechol pathway
MFVTMSGVKHELGPSKIICLLRSYAEHADEMGSEIPDRPRFFLKPPSSLLEHGGTVIIPSGSREVHHEVELAVIMGRRGKDIPLGEVPSHILSYTVMLDITARDIQGEAKRKGLPWSEAKGFDTFAPVGPEMIPRSEMDWKGRNIWLEVNGERRQDSNTDLLLWPVEEIISRISEMMTLEEGDIIMTGTPAGVGPLRPGDVVRAGIDGIPPLEVKVSYCDQSGDGVVV